MSSTRTAARALYTHALRHIVSRTYTHAHTHAHAHTNAHTHTHAHAHTNAHTHTHAHTHTNAQAHNIAPRPEFLMSLRRRAALERGARSLVLPEGGDPRVVLAACRAVQSGMCARVVLLGSVGDVRRAAVQAGVPYPLVDGVEVLHHVDSGHRAMLRDYAAEYVDMKSRSRRNVSNKRPPPTADEGRDLMRDPAFFANMMVRHGEADGSVCGAVRTTAETVQAAISVLGPAPGNATVSSFFLMSFADESKSHLGENGTMLYSDCGVVVNPTASQLADIAWTTAHSCDTFLRVPPRIAMLSFSTLGSATHADANKVIEATAMVRQRMEERGNALKMSIAGELQLDAAIDPIVAGAKVQEHHDAEHDNEHHRPSSVAGRANVLIFPTLDAGNIAYKLTQRLAHAAAVGPILQGLAHPANDLSRGCDAEDIVDAMAITLLQSPDAPPRQ